MYLKNIEIHGFKSFANKINLEFHNGITGIVGPNGSGKSNIADAVRWVLGEQKTKQLRSSKMEDVIFSGTQNRKPMGYAYVSITFDNSDHMLGVDYNEVTVSRRLFRSGESEYMINGTGVRLRDVQEMFYDTGIGKEGYSLIGQGQIDRILNGKPEERRELFDEAAGIVKFKRRKSEALKKLDDENRNLIRVTDILGELERQVVPLEKQAQKAKRYLVLKDDLKINDVNLFLIQTDEMRKKMEDIDKKISIVQADTQDTNDELKRIKTEYTQLENMLETMNRSVEDKKEQLSETVLEIEKSEGRINVMKEQIYSAQNSESFIQSRMTAINDALTKNNSELDSYINEKKENESVLKTLIEKQTNITTEIATLTDASDVLEKELETDRVQLMELMNAKVRIKTEIEKFDTLLEQIHLRKEGLNQKLIEFQNETENQKKMIYEFQNQLTDIDQEIHTVQKTMEDKKKNLTAFKEESSNLSRNLAHNTEEYHKLRSNLEALQNITERYEGYGNSIRKVMDLKSSNKGIIGVVADIVKVDKKYEVAIETALGGNIQNIVTDTETTAKKTIEYLKKNRFGRATFLPLSSMSNKTNFNAPDALEEIGVLGLASELVNIQKKYEGIAKYLLGRVMVVDTIDHAISIARKYRYTVRIVTLEGEYLNVGGSISGGAFKNTSNLLGRRREIEDLEKHLSKLQNEKGVLEKELLNNQGKISAVTEEIGKISEALQEQILFKRTIELKLNQVNQKINNLTNEYQEYTKENEDISSSIQDIHHSTEELTKELCGAKDRNVLLETSVREKSEKLGDMREKKSTKASELEQVNIEIANVRQKHDFIAEKISTLNTMIKELNNEFAQVKDNSKENDEEITARKEAIHNLTKEIESGRTLIERLKEEIQTAQRNRENQTKEHKDFFEKREVLTKRISELDKELYRLQMKKESLTEKSENKESYMWNEYEITYRQALEMKKPDYTDKNTIRETISKIRKEMKTLGDVNIGAVEEFKEINERYQFMKSQYNDLMKAKHNLMTVIEELEIGMRKRFIEKFEAIKVEFNYVFQELFGGGKGDIELTQADDVLDAGIRIISQPPGKKLQNIMQLSGGEKTLTAISLLFAIQNLKPSPFCLLDEIEAALDGSNVIRFARYLHKLTKNTQFIVITHRRGTMGCADRLYGITMQEKGVSTLVSVNLLKTELSN